MQTIARYYIAYHIEWISGTVLFIAGTRAIADGAAGSNQAKFNLLSKLL